MATPSIGYLNGLLRLFPWWSDTSTGPLSVYSFPAIVLITGLALVPFVVVYVSSALDQMDGSLIEAARVFGAGMTRTYVRVVLPILRPSIVYATIIIMLLGLGQFTAPLLLGVQQGVNVITTEIYIQASAAPPAFASAAGWALPLIVFGFLMLWVQSHQLAARRRFVTVNARGASGSLRPSAWYAVPLILFVVVAVVIPLLGITFVALSPFWSARIPWTNLTFDVIKEVLLDPETLSSIKTTLLTSSIATVIAGILGYAVACYLVIGRHEIFQSKKVIEGVVNLPVTIPSTVFGIGVLLLYAGPPFRLYGTYVIFILTYSLLILPHMIRIVMAGLIALGPSVIEAARVAGAHTLFLHRRILFPLLRRQVAGGAAISLAILSHEFGASVLVRSTGSQVMGTRLYELYNSGLYPSVAAMALIMTFVTAALIFCMIAYVGRAALEGKAV
jgi:iron(III) transport system permease protein